MSAGTIRRYHGRRAADVPEEAAWLCWADGTIADSRACPVGRLDRAHWTRTSAATDTPNATCDHHRPEKEET